MNRWTAPENDTRGLPTPPHQSDVKVSVVIPVFNRVALLERVIAGLAVQDHPPHLVEVIVADDGSTEDVAGALAAWHDRLDLTVVRRDHEGYGAGQARNLGARTATGDVVLFVDADCLPARSLVRRHAAWHTLAENLVVVGARHDLDTSDVTAGAIGEGAFRIDDGDGVPPSDWRALFYRRTARLMAGDEAYRAVVSNNLSARRDSFLEVGGFCEDFVRWGGEDTELGWRFARAGCFIVADDHAVVHHQVQEDGEEGWRDAQRARNDGMVRTKIPHSFYRRVEPGVRFEVPKVSWVVVPTEPALVELLWAELQGQAFTDQELVVHDPDGALAVFADLHRGDPRVRVVTTPDPLDAVAAARGELLLLLHGAATPDRHASARIVRKLDAAPRTQLLTVGVTERLGAEFRVWEQPQDVAAVGTALGLPWPPLTAVRGREVAKVLPQVEDLGALWAALQPLVDAAHIRTPLVIVTDPQTRTANRGRAMRMPTPRRTLGDALAGDASAAAGTRALLGGVKKKLASSPAVTPAARPGEASVVATATVTTAVDRPLALPSVEPTEDEKVIVRYLGWTGQSNIGDEAMLAAARDLMPWADVRTKGPAGRLLVLGGGTLINRFSYLRLLKELDSPRSERAVLGTGVAAPEYWGQTESAEDWAQFLATCGYVGVRGPDSVQRLRTFGYGGPLEMSGDLALALPPPEGVERVPGRLVIAPVHTGGKLHGGDDMAVLDTLGDLVGAAVAEGREVHLMSCHPNDDRWCFTLMRRAGHPDLPFLAGYDDLDATMAVLASADAVVAERLHAGVLAAVAGTPFVPVEYRPKARDFARSVEGDDVLLRTDELTLDGLRGALVRLDNNRAERTERIAAHVTTHRASLRAAAATIEGLVR